MKSDSPSSKKILVVDPFPIIRHGLAQLIATQPDWLLGATADNSQDAAELVEAVGPDGLIFELSMESGRGFDLIRRIVRLRRKTRILVFSELPEIPYAAQSVRLGAHGFVKKDASLATVVEALRTVLDGKTHLSRAAQRGLNYGSKAGHRRPPPELSTREIQILHLFGSGLKPGETATELHLSPKTVETHCAHIRQKLQLESNRELRQYAARLRAQDCPGY